MVAAERKTLQRNIYARRQNSDHHQEIETAHLGFSKVRRLFLGAYIIFLL
jgi:hypothetical protein